MRQRQSSRARWNEGRT